MDLQPPPYTQGHSRPYGSRLCRSPPAPIVLHTAVLDVGITEMQGRLREYPPAGILPGCSGQSLPQWQRLGFRGHKKISPSGGT